ncbi:MAG: hypothetical protein WBZ37_29025 [Mycobacterium sp.]
MPLSDKAREAREHADGCTNPSCHAVANALEGALSAPARGAHEPIWNGRDGARRWSGPRADSARYRGTGAYSL